MISNIAKTLQFSVMLAGLCSPAFSTSLPQSGSTAYTAYFGCHQLDKIDMGDSGSQSVAECVGITKNETDPKLFDTMSVVCLEDGESRVGAYKFNGWCAQTDADGDKLYTSYTGPENGPIAYIGGTGKYKNLSLEGTWAVHDAPALPVGQFAFVIDYKITWQSK